MPLPSADGREDALRERGPGAYGEHRELAALRLALQPLRIEGAQPRPAAPHRRRATVEPVRALWHALQNAILIQLQQEDGAYLPSAGGVRLHELGNHGWDDPSAFEHEGASRGDVVRHDVP